MFEGTSTWRIEGSLDAFQIELAPYDGIDFSRIAFMFCGQGQIARGSMADVAAIHPVFVTRFREIDELAAARGYGKPSRYLLDAKAPLTDEEEALFSTLCLFGLQLSMFEVAIHRGFVPEALTAHSFGEYGMLVAAGVFDFRDMVELLIARAEAIAAARPPAASMFVVSGARMDSMTFARPVRLANRNTPFQSTYVCLEEDFPSVKADLKRNRIPFVPIPLRIPFHTPWLEEARANFAGAIARFRPRASAPKIPFVSSVTGRWVDRGTFDPDAVLRALSEQLTTTVDFPAQLSRLHERRVHHFFELSPSDVLLGFAEQCQDLTGGRIKVNSFRRHFKTLQATNKTYDRFKNSKLFTALDTALKSLTGYSIHSIQLEDRIREDLGIDSIKKAEIVFEIIDLVQSGTGLAPTNLADLSSFGDILEYLEASQERQETAELATLETPPAFAPFSLDWSARPLVDYQPYRSETLIIEDRERDADWDAHAALDFVLSLQAKPVAAARVVLLHAGSPRALAKRAFLTTYAQERKFLFKSIELGAEETIDRATIDLETEDFRNAHVRYREGRREVLEHRPRALAGARATNRNVLFLGGLGGIGFHQLMALESPARIALVGRRPNEERLAAIRARHPDARVDFFVHSIEDEASLDAFLSKLEHERGAFDLFVHSAGIEHSAELANAESDELAKVLGAKLIAARVLARRARENCALRVVFNSSVVSEFPSRGQSAYALANGYLNALASTSPNILAIAWPGWENTGVTTGDLNRRSLKLQGARMLNAADGGKIFARLLAAFAPGTVYVLDGAGMAEVMRENESRPATDRLLRPASRGHEIMSVPSLNQREMPYLTDHLVQRACIFPGSGSLALMLYRAYLKTGKLGNVKNFQAVNFLVVPAESSNVTVRIKSQGDDRLALQVFSHQLLAQCDVVFEETGAPSAIEGLRTDRKGVTDFDQNISVFTGPKFLLTDVCFLNTREKYTVLQLDLERAPRYLASGFVDKFHRLLEFAFNSSHSRAIQDFGALTVPKSFGEIRFNPENLGGTKFTSLIREMKGEHALFGTDVLIVDELGRPAIEIKDMASVAVGEKASRKSKGFKLFAEERTFFEIR